LEAANADVVNEHHRHPLAQRFGGGTLSSSDGLRLPMRGKSLTAKALSRYFLHEGVTTYCHVSDQHSTYGTQVIVSTDRDGLYVLDEILGNTTELPIVEHTTDSHGQLLATFALFDLVGKTLSPRIAKIAESRGGDPMRPATTQDAIDAHEADGHEVSDEVIAHMSPAHFEALNPYGTHNIDVAGILGRGGRRPLWALKAR